MRLELRAELSLAQHELPETFADAQLDPAGENLAAANRPPPPQHQRIEAIRWVPNELESRPVKGSNEHAFA